MGKQKDRESGFLFFPLRRGLRPLSLSELAAFPAACPLPSRAATGLGGLAAAEGHTAAEE